MPKRKDRPQSNGLNERLHQTLVNRIRCKINSNKEIKRAWTTIAQKGVQEYNNTIHSVTQFSPACLLLGKDSEPVPEELQNQRDLQVDRAQAVMNSDKNNKNKYRIDKENELVYVEKGNRLNRNKLDKLRSGFFRIRERLSNTIYKVDCRKTHPEASLFHVSKLIPKF